MTAIAVLSVAIGAWLWVRQYRRPPDDAAARRRLRRELARHNTDLYEHQP